MQQRSTVRILFSALLLVLSVLGFINVFGDNAAVVVMAREAACGGTDCQVQRTEASRNPLWQSFDFELGGKHAGSVSVECHRDFYFAGAYHCARK